MALLRYDGMAFILLIFKPNCMLLHLESDKKATITVVLSTLAMIKLRLSKPTVVGAEDTVLNTLW